VAVPGGVPRDDPEDPSSGRVHNFLLDGRNHGEADERAARQLGAICPEARQIAAVNRLFITRTGVYAA